MKRENFYRRDPGAALQGMVSMTLEERGVYNTVIDLLYLTWRPLEDNRGYIAGHCGCAVQKLNPILNRLIEKRKLIRFEVDGEHYISNAKFEDERRSVKGVTTRSGRAEVGEKSAGVEEKSEGVGKNPPLLDLESVENQTLAPLDKSRQDKSSSEAIASSPSACARDLDEVVEQVVMALWGVWPEVGLRRSGKRELRKVIRAELVAGAAAERLIAAGSAYAADKSAWGSSGQPKAIAEWFALGRWADFVPAVAAVAAAVDLFRFEGPPELRQKLCETQGESFVRKYLDPARYDPGGQAVLPANGYARDELARAWFPIKSMGYVLGDVQRGVA